MSVCVYIYIYIYIYTYIYTYMYIYRERGRGHPGLRSRTFRKKKTKPIINKHIYI